MRQVDVVLHGVGNVGRRLLALFEQQAPLLARRHGLEVRVVGAVDSGGALANPNGLAIPSLLAAKLQGKSVATLPGGQPGETIGPLIATFPGPAVLLESTLVNLNDGEPGLGAMHAALQAGWAVVSANKGPLVLAFAALAELAGQGWPPRLAYSATVCGGLPVVNIGQRDLAHCTVVRLQGILNSTTNYLLTEMATGRPFGDALAQAQRDGIAEADPTLDVSGWDAANKLIILANAMLRRPTTARDVRVTGIEGVSAADLQAAAAAGTTIKLIAQAEQQPDGDYALTVAPQHLPLDHPLAGLHGHQMGLWLQTDINGELFLAITENDPIPTAAAMLRDLLTVSGAQG